MDTISCEEITIKIEEIEEGSENFNNEDSHRETCTNATGSSLYILDIVKEEPRIAESTSTVAKINDSDEFNSNLEHPEGSINEPDDILSCLAKHLANIHAEHSDSEDDVPISILKSRLVTDRETDSQKTKIENRYKCKECDMLFNDREEFRTHCRNHVCGDKHECNICGKKFAKRRYLRIHLEIHYEEKKYKCSICGKDFHHYSNRRKHMKIHSERKPFECEICSKKFGRRDHLKRHMESHNRVIKKCGQCGKEFKNSEGLKGHMKWHTNPKPFKCQKCGKRFADKRSYTRHMEICKPLDNPKEEAHQKGNTENTCTECNITLNDKEEFEAHCRNHGYGGKHKCNICGKKFVRHQYLLYHLVIRDEEKEYTCSICGIGYKHLVNLHKHLADLHGIHSDGKHFECKICSKKFGRKSNLKRHLENHSGIKKKCDKCGKELKNSESLRGHMKWHTNPKPFKCQKCGKRFADKRSNTRHVGICKPLGNPKEETHQKGHTENTCTECNVTFNDKEEFEIHCRNRGCGVTHDEKNKYKCSICGKDFKRSANRWRHMIIHSLGKAFECEICSKKFRRKSNLKDHMETHNGIIKKCDQCDKEFKYAKGLRRHMKWHTNPKPFKCENCEKLFSNKFSYILHMKICKPVGYSNEETHQKEHTDNTCTECDMVFNDKEEFEAHCQNHGYGVIRDEEKGYKCSICGIGYKHLANLHQHLGDLHGIHSGGKHFECEICSKKFRKKSNLKRHIENHSGITKKCDKCGKELKNSDTLWKHMKWHTNPKPFKCESCGKLFADKRGYTFHMEICKPLDNPKEETITIGESGFHSKRSHSTNNAIECK